MIGRFEPFRVSTNWEMVEGELRFNMPWQLMTTCRGIPVPEEDVVAYLPRCCDQRLKFWAWLSSGESCRARGCNFRVC